MLHCGSNVLHRGTLKNQAQAFFSVYMGLSCATNGPQMKKESKSEIIRARCGRDLKEDVERVAFLKQLDPADIIRIAVRDYIQRFRNSDHHATT